MPYANRHNATEPIKISASTFIKNVLPFALHDHQWSFVVKEKPGIQKLATQARHLFRRRPTVRLRLIIEWREFRFLHHFVLQALSAPSANQRLWQLAPSFCYPRQCPPVTVYPAARKSSANSNSI